MNVFVTEGSTQLLVPDGSQGSNAPPKDPAFFNPRARINRDMSLLAYAAHSKKYNNDLTYLDALCGLGARGLRVANELDGFEDITLNDANPEAIKMAKKSAAKNNLKNIQFSNQDACKFLCLHSETGMHAMATDVDPFGSPAKYLECAIRSIAHGGMLSATATDLQVLRGLFPDACMRRYGGVPIRRAEFGSEVGIRLILGCLGHICARIDRSFVPLYAHCNQHYYRVYVQIKNRSSLAGTGYMYFCPHCNNRGTLKYFDTQCPHCGKKSKLAGPLWIGNLFDGKFISCMSSESSNLNVDASCIKNLEKSLSESSLPPAFYTLDELAKSHSCAPPKLADAIMRLQNSGYVSSPTSFEPTGFRTNATFEQILDTIFYP